MQYGANRCHTRMGYTDITQKEIEHFSKLGTSLGYIPCREWTGDPCRYPRDLVWLRPSSGQYGLPTDERVFLHLERETKDRDCLECLTSPHNKLLNSSYINDGRYLVGIFGWITNETWTKIVGWLTEQYQDRNVLIIGWIGDDSDSADDVQGLVWSSNTVRQRNARAVLDNGGYWYLFFRGSWE